MSTKNFTQFDTAAPLTTGDYIVGYNAAGTSELKTRVQDIFNLASLSAFVESNTTIAVSASAVSNIVTITQAGYDNIVTKDPSTVYIIV